MVGSPSDALERLSCWASTVGLARPLGPHLNTTLPEALLVCDLLKRLSGMLLKRNFVDQ